MFTKLAWLRSPCWCDTSTATATATAAVVRDSTHPRAIPLAMLTMKKETLGFHSFYMYMYMYAWFSSVSTMALVALVEVVAL